MPPPVGGATVLFRQLAEELSMRAGLTVTVIDTSRRHGIYAAALRAGTVIYQMMTKMRTCDIVSFHSSRRGAAMFGPIVLVLARLFNKPWIFRGFGDFESWHKSTNRLNRQLFRIAALKANVVLFETKSAVAYFQSSTHNDIRWYPNSRPYVPDSTFVRPIEEKLRFVFVGHVKPSKGIRELIAASECLGDVCVDVYGPLLEGIHESEFQGKSVRYCGALESSQVAAVLKAYDVLIVPTYYDGEGYPGIILEGYAQGLPVIASRWRAVPEIVTSETGILIEPRNVPDLADAMLRISNARDSLPGMRDAAVHLASLFASQIWTDVFGRVVWDLLNSVNPKFGATPPSVEAALQTSPAPK